MCFAPRLSASDRPLDWRLEQTAELHEFIETVVEIEHNQTPPMTVFRLISRIHEQREPDTVIGRGLTAVAGGKAQQDEL